MILGGELLAHDFRSLLDDLVGDFAANAVKGRARFVLGAGHGLGLHGQGVLLGLLDDGGLDGLHPIDPAAYHEGWARNGEIVGSHEKYGYTLKLNHNGALEQGGPLFWSHYSYLGLDPRKLTDRYANYWEHNVAHTMINYEHCVANPQQFKGYSENCWGLTASYSVKGYDAHMPSNDLGVISPTAALSSFPYSPEQSLRAARYFYENLGEKLMGPYGFYDAFSETENWFPPRYLAIDQGPIVVMIENYRTGLLWNLFMKDADIQQGLKKLDFSF